MLLLPLKRPSAAMTSGSRLAFSSPVFLFGLGMEPLRSAFTCRAWSSSIFRRYSSEGPSCSSLFRISEPVVTRAVAVARESPSPLYFRLFLANRDSPSPLHLSAIFWQLSAAPSSPSPPRISAILWQLIAAPGSHFPPPISGS